MQLFMLFIWW